MLKHSPQHVNFLKEELSNLLPKNSVAFHIKKDMGKCLWEILQSNGIKHHLFPHRIAVANASKSPVKALYDWVSYWGGLSPNYFDDAFGGEIYGDDGTIVIGCIKPSECKDEREEWKLHQLVVLGLWVIESELDRHGDEFSKNDMLNDQDHRIYEVMEHKAACIEFAYQALTYSLKFKAGIKAKKEKKGGLATASKKHSIRREAERLVKLKVPASGKWKSAAMAAKSIENEVKQFAVSIGLPLSNDRARKTIQDWLGKMSEASTLFETKSGTSASKRTTSASNRATSTS